MSQSPQPQPQADDVDLEASIDLAILACGGDMRATIRALIVANRFLEASVSPGYVRGSLPRDRKDWYD